MAVSTILTQQNVSVALTTIMRVMILGTKPRIFTARKPVNFSCMVGAAQCQVTQRHMAQQLPAEKSGVPYPLTKQRNGQSIIFPQRSTSNFSERWKNKLHLVSNN